MIQIERADLDAHMTLRLQKRTVQLVEHSATSEDARRMWNSAKTERHEIRQRLETMALGMRRCMYCGDNLGTDIDHFEPVRRAPLRAFDWPNHLLACSFCNSNQKRGEYPCDSSGQCLLIDPTRDDPSDHIRLVLSTGEYRELTDRGSATIRVFGLNRADLVRGRVNAFYTRRAVLCRAHDLLSQDREAEASRCLAALAEEPHASVLQAMILYAPLPGSEDVLGTDVIAALRDPKIRGLVTIREQKAFRAVS